MVAAVIVLFQKPASAQDASTVQPGLDKDAAKVYAPYPEPESGYVTDLADLLTDEEEERIEQWLWQVESKTGVEIVVVTIFSIRDYPEIGVSRIEDFARGMFNRYGIGNMPENNGILLVVALHDRKARIELGAAYGNLRDRDSSQIMDGKIVPSFKRGDYAQGITSGVKALASEFANTRFGVNWPLIIMIALIPIIALISVSLFRNGKRGWGWVCVGMLIVLLLAILRVLATVSKHLPDSSSDSWSAGGFGGGFGGGFSGGGGATGSW